MTNQINFNKLFKSLLFLILLISASLSAQEAKYVFFFIGDGMGLAHVAAAEAFMEADDNNNTSGGLSFTKFPVTGLSTTFAENRFITGSAAAGTALATGQKTSINTIGMDAAKKLPLETIAEGAKKNGFKVGIISSVSIDHATPACFYAHQPERNMYYQIALELPASNFDFFGGGGFKDYGGADGQISVVENALNQGYKITDTKNEFYELKKGDGKVIAMGSVLEPSGAMRYAIDQTHEDIPLKDFVSKSIELLYSEKGFFIMCEEGKIDWAAHENDGASAVNNVIALSEAVESAIDFYRKHPDETLIVVTADHETGGFAMGSSLKKYDSDIKLLKLQEISAQSFTVLADSLFSIRQNQNPEFAMHLVEVYFGLGGETGIPLSDYETEMLESAYFVSAGKTELESNQEYQLYGGYHPLAVTATHILNNRAGLGWTTWSHTASPVPVYVLGAGSDSFNGFYDNTDIPKKIARAMNINFNN